MEYTISWSIANLITVTLMVVAVFLVVSLGAKMFRRAGSNGGPLPEGVA